MYLPPECSPIDPNPFLTSPSLECDVLQLPQATMHDIRVTTRDGLHAQ